MLKINDVYGLSTKAFKKSFSRNSTNVIWATVLLVTFEFLENN